MRAASWWSRTGGGAATSELSRAWPAPTWACGAMTSCPVRTPSQEERTNHDVVNGSAAGPAGVAAQPSAFGTYRPGSNHRRRGADRNGSDRGGGAQDGGGADRVDGIEHVDGRPEHLDQG